MTAVHAVAKSFAPFSAAYDGESADMNCLVFWVLYKNGKIGVKCQVYNKRIFSNFGNSECAVDSDVVSNIAECLVV